MSKLFGPLSVTNRSVSWRDCALADDQTAGAVTMLASAAVDFRKSRRFMMIPSRTPAVEALPSSAVPHPQNAGAHLLRCWQHDDLSEACGRPRWCRGRAGTAVLKKWALDRFPIRLNRQA